MGIGLGIALGERARHSVGNRVRDSVGDLQVVAEQARVLHELSPYPVTQLKLERRQAVLQGLGVGVGVGLGVGRSSFIWLGLVRLRVRVRGGVGVGVRVERRQAVLALGTTHVLG